MSRREQEKFDHMAGAQEGYAARGKEFRREIRDLKRQKRKGQLTNRERQRLEYLQALRKRRVSIDVPKYIAEAAITVLTGGGAAAVKGGVAAGLEAFKLAAKEGGKKVAKLAAKRLALKAAEKAALKGGEIAAKNKMRKKMRKAEAQALIAEEFGDFGNAAAIRQAGATYEPGLEAAIPVAIGAAKKFGPGALERFQDSDLGERIQELPQNIRDKVQDLPKNIKDKLYSERRELRQDKRFARRAGVDPTQFIEEPGFEFGSQSNLDFITPVDATAIPSAPVSASIIQPPPPPPPDTQTTMEEILAGTPFADVPNTSAVDIDNIQIDDVEIDELKETFDFDETDNPAYILESREALELEKIVNPDAFSAGVADYESISNEELKSMTMPANAGYAMIMPEYVEGETTVEDYANWLSTQPGEQQGDFDRSLSLAKDSLVLSQKDVAVDIGESEVAANLRQEYMDNYRKQNPGVSEDVVLLRVGNWEANELPIILRNKQLELARQRALETIEADYPGLSGLEDVAYPYVQPDFPSSVVKGRREVQFTPSQIQTKIDRDKRKFDEYGIYNVYMSKGGRIQDHMGSIKDTRKYIMNKYA